MVYGVPSIYEEVKYMLTRISILVIHWCVCVCAFYTLCAIVERPKFYR